jgi:stage II sporulation protein D
MKNKILMAVLALMPFVSGLEAAPLDQLKDAMNPKVPTTAPSIRVLIVHDKPGALIEVKGRYKLFDPKHNSYISTRFVGKRKFIQPIADGLRWGEEFPGLHQLLIIPEDPNTTTIVDGIEYRGTMYIYDVEGKIGVVNSVNVEDYLKSTLARRYLETLDDEALAAAMITERTNAYYYVANPKSPYWSVDAQDVGYQGYAVTGRNIPVEDAIRATRYLIMSEGTASQGEPHPFAAKWNPTPQDKGAIASKLKLQDANEMSKKGDNAAQILSKAYPGSALMLMYHESAKR